MSNHLLGFDTETTGVDVFNDRIVTCCLIYDGPEPVVRNWLINPGVEIPEAATAVHGITTEFARTHGDDPRFALEEIAAALAAHLSAGNPVVAYNANYDLTLLESELARYGLATLTERLGHIPSPIIDPMVVDKAMEPYRRGKRRLIDLVTYYGVADNDNFHNAEADVAATLRVWKTMCERYPELASHTMESLFDFECQAYVRQNESFRAWAAGKGLTHIVDSPSGWPLQKPVK